MARAARERVAALRAEEVPVVPVRPERHHVLPDDRRRAVLAARREPLVPVEVAVEPQPGVAVVVLLRLPRSVGRLLAGRARRDAGQARRALRRGLRRDLKVRERSVADVARHALGMPALGEAGERDDAAFDGELARVAGCGGAWAGGGPVAAAGGWGGRALAVGAGEGVLACGFGVGEGPRGGGFGGVGGGFDD